MQRVPSGATFNVVRVSRPTFTYEFAKQIATQIYVEINRVTARTSFDKDKLNAYFSVQADTMNRWFAVEGMHRMISNAAWNRILELNKLHPDSIKEDKTTGKVTGQNHWSYTYFYSICCILN